MFCSMHGRKENPREVGMERVRNLHKSRSQILPPRVGGGGEGEGGGGGRIFCDIGFLLIVSYSSYYGS